MDNFNYKKSLGQNFLQDINVLTNIVKSANIKDNSLTIEVGPGSGNLTKEIAKVSNQVLCYEIDTTLKELLKDNLSELDNVDIIYKDFLVSNVVEDIKKYMGVTPKTYRLNLSRMQKYEVSKENWNL